MASGASDGGRRRRSRAAVAVSVVSALALAGSMVTSAAAQSARDAATDLGDITGEGSAQFVDASLSGSVGNSVQDNKETDKEVDPQQDAIVPRIHGTPLPWTGHTMHDIERYQTHELTSSDTEIWYRMENLDDGRMYLYQKYNPRGRLVRRSRIEIYDSNGVIAKQKGNDDDAIGQAWTYKSVGGNKIRFGTWLYWVPPSDGTYYLRFYSRSNNKGRYSLRVWSEEIRDQGDRTGTDCGEVFTAATCQVKIGSTGARGGAHLVTENDEPKKIEVDRDIYKAYLFKGVQYRICVSSSDDGHLGLRPIVQTVWGIYGDSRQSGTQEVCLNYTAPWTGSFPIQVRTNRQTVIASSVVTVEAISNYTISVVEL